MRRFRTIGLTLAAAALATAAMAADGDHRVVTVTGDAEVKVAPDEVTLVLGVEKFDKELTKAKSDNDAVVKRVIAAAKALGVEEKHIQTDFIRVEPRYRHDHERREFVCYVVQKTVTVTLKEVSKFEDLLSRSLDAGATHVHGVQFRTTELRKYRDQARAMAVKAAREKAVDLAKVLDQKVGRPRSIAEHGMGWSYPYNSWWGGRYGGYLTQNSVQNVGGGAAAGSIALGQISVTARVTVTFELED